MVAQRRIDMVLLACIVGQSVVGMEHKKSLTICDKERVVISQEELGKNPKELLLSHQELFLERVRKWENSHSPKGRKSEKERRLRYINRSCLPVRLGKLASQGLAK